MYNTRSLSFALLKLLRKRKKGSKMKKNKTHLIIEVKSYFFQVLNVSTFFSDFLFSQNLPYEHVHVRS